MCTQLKQKLFTPIALLSLLSPSISHALDTNDLLNLSLKELMNIEIDSASKTSSTVGEIPASVVIISRQDIKRYGYSSLEETLNNIPGMYMTEDWAWFGSVNYGVRGLYSKGNFDNMAILVNGVSQMEDGKRSYPLEKVNVPVQAIDRIEVIRGPMSVIYGSSAFLGVINIITNLPSAEGEDNIISFSEGDFSSQKKFVRFSGQEGLFSFVFNAQNQSAAGPDHRYSDLITDTSTLPADWNLSGDDKTVLGHESQYFDFSAQFKDLKIFFSHVNASSNVVDSQPGVGSGSRSFTRATNVSAHYIKQIKDNLQFTGKASFFYNNYFLDEEFNFTGFFSNNQSTTEAQEYELNLIWIPTDSLEATFGVMRRTGQYKAYDDYPTFALDNNEILVDEQDGLNTNALFTQIKVNAADDLTIVGGLRAEWQEDYKITIYKDNIDINNQNNLSKNYSYDDIHYTPQLSGIYDISKKQHFKLMLSAGEKAPSPVNNFSILELEKDAFKSERTRSIEASYILAKEDLFLQISAFHNKASNLIIGSAILENNVFVSSLDNTGEIETLGLELTTTAQLSRSLNINFDISLHDVEDKTPGYENIDAAYAPTTISNLRTTYSFNSDTHLSLLGHYTSSVLPEWKIADTGNTLEERISNGTRTGNKIEAMSSADLNLVVENAYAKNLDISLKIGNITDETLRYPTINNRAFDKGTIGMNRHVLMTIEYAF